MKKLLLGLLALVMGFSLIIPTAPVFADDNHCVDTAFFGEQCDQNGDSIYRILNLVVDIMTIGIGVLGVIGITIVGIQYLTAGGSEEKTRKAKRRMFEIILGLVAYVAIYAVLKWLMPSFTSNNPINQNTTSQTQVTVARKLK